jgi:hypothetical protein
MLPTHAPLRIAEQFGTLDTLHPVGAGNDIAQINRSSEGRE